MAVDWMVYGGMVWYGTSALRNRMVLDFHSRSMVVPA